MATHSSILAWKIPQREEPSGLQSMGLHELDTTEHTPKNKELIYKSIWMTKGRRSMCDGKGNIRATSPSFLFFIIIFISVFLFLAVLGLHCCVSFFFPSCIAVAPLGCGAWALGHMGFSKLQNVGSTVVISFLWSTDSVIVAHGLSYSKACGISPDQGLKLVSPVLAGRFFTTESAGKPLHLLCFFPSPSISNVNRNLKIPIDLPSQ